MTPVRIYRDASAEARTAQAYHDYQAEGGKIFSGTVYALFGIAVAVMSAGVLLLGDGGPRPTLALFVALAVAGFGAMRSSAAASRRETHAATLRQRRPYIVTSEAERALRRVIAVRREQHAINPLSSASAEADELVARAWRLVRALDAGTPTWRFDDPDTFIPLVAEKAQQDEQGILLMLADRAERNLEDTGRRRDEAIADANQPRDEAIAARMTEAAAPVDATASAEVAAQMAGAIASEVQPDQIAVMLSGGVADDVAEWDLNNPR